jgi:hypothetical protein
MVLETQKSVLPNQKNNKSIDPTTNSISTNLINIHARLYDNSTWENTSAALKKMALLQGLPFVIYSYAAGIFKSNNRFNLYGLIDLFTYASRLNILGALNINHDITFTFLNEKKISDSYIATYTNGIFGSALNIFMNPIDFNTMDEIIDKNVGSNIVYNSINKISMDAMASPKYFQLNTLGDISTVQLNEFVFTKYKSIIYGGIDYEQIAIILNNIPNYCNIDDKGPDGFTFPIYIFHYYIELYFDELKDIYAIFDNPINSEWSGSSVYTFSENYYTNLFGGSTDLSNINNYRHSVLADRIYEITNNDISLNYNEIFPYFFKNIFDISYNYGQIFFFSNHKNIKEIYIMDLSAGYMDNRDYDFIDKDFVQKTIKIYDYKFDNYKKDSLEAIYSIILMPVEPGNMNNGEIGTINYQYIFEKNIRTTNTSFPEVSNSDNTLIAYLANTDIAEKTIYPYNIYYTILCGLDDSLSSSYVENIQTYESFPARDNINKNNIINKTFLCYYDGNNETFKKIITNSNNQSTLDDFNGLKKIINYNSNNSFQNLNNDTPNIIDTITSFVYNINEGKAYDLNVTKNNPMSYNAGLVLGIDSIILIYIAQIYYDDYSRIFSSDEIFEAYHAIINNNDYGDVVNYTVKKYNNLLKFNSILRGKYTIKANNQIIDNDTGILYDSIDHFNDENLANDIVLNDKDEFFISISAILKRDLNTLNQKSYYKILEFNSDKYFDSNGNIDGIDINKKVKEDFLQTEDKWYDITYKSVFNYDTSLNNTQNLYYNNIINYLSDFNNLSDSGIEFINQDDAVNINSNDISGYIDFSNYKHNISIRESLVLLKSYSLKLFSTINNDNLAEQIFNTYKILRTDNTLSNDGIISYAYMDLLLNNHNNIYSNYTNLPRDIAITSPGSLFMRDIYLYIYFMNVFNRDTQKAKEMFLYYIKFQLLLIFTRDEYYKYINNIIYDNIGMFNDPSFNNIIKLDELPYLDSDENEHWQHEKTLNFTFVDILNKIYNKIDDTVFNYHDTLSIVDLLKFIFINGNGPMTHDMYLLIEFIKNINEPTMTDADGSEKSKLTFEEYIVENALNYKPLLLLFFDNVISIYDILSKVKHNTNDIFINDINYANKFVTINDNDRYKLFQQYKEYY